MCCRHFRRYAFTVLSNIFHFSAFPRFRRHKLRTQFQLCINTESKLVLNYLIVSSNLMIKNSEGKNSSL